MNKCRVGTGIELHTQICIGKHGWKQECTCDGITFGIRCGRKRAGNETDLKHEGRKILIQPEEKPRGLEQDTTHRHECHL